MKQAGENSNSLKMVFRNRPENEKIVRTTAAVFASVLDPTLEEISDFKTAVSEAVTNAIIHASGLSRWAGSSCIRRFQ